MNNWDDGFTKGLVWGLVFAMSSIGITIVIMNDINNNRFIKRGLAHWEVNPKTGQTSFVITNLNSNIDK